MFHRAKSPKLWSRVSTNKKISSNEQTSKVLNKQLLESFLSSQINCFSPSTLKTCLNYIKFPGKTICWRTQYSSSTFQVKHKYNYWYVWNMQFRKYKMKCTHLRSYHINIFAHFFYLILQNISSIKKYYYIFCKDQLKLVKTNSVNHLLQINSLPSNLIPIPKLSKN